MGRKETPAWDAPERKLIPRRRSGSGYERPIRPPPSLDPTVALYLGHWGDPMGVGVSHERGTPGMGRDVTLSHVTFWMSARLAFLKVRKRPRNFANSTSDRTMASAVVLDGGVCALWAGNWGVWDLLLGLWMR